MQISGDVTSPEITGGCPDAGTQSAAFNLTVLYDGVIRVSETNPGGGIGRNRIACAVSSFDKPKACRIIDEPYPIFHK